MKFKSQIISEEFSFKFVYALFYGGVGNKDKILSTFKGHRLFPAPQIPHTVRTW